jgi:hypothetical protein
MFELNSNDFTSLPEFKLNWRFGGKHYDLPKDALEVIRPLTHKAADRVMTWIGGLHGTDFEARFEDVAELQVDGRFDDDREGSVSEWFSLHIPDHSSEIVISYDAETALLVDRSIFVEYWGAFLFPVEDVILVPPDASWTVTWDYKQNLYYSRARPK